MKLIKIFPPLLFLLAGFASGILTDLYHYNRENALKYIDVQFSPSGGLDSSEIGNGVKAQFTDLTGNKIDAYKFIEARVFNFSGSPVGEAKLTFEIAKARMDASVSDKPLRALSISILHDGLSDEAAEKTVRTWSKDGAFYLSFILKNLSSDIGSDPRNKVLVTMEGNQPLRFKAVADGANLMARNYEWQHSVDADDPLAKYKNAIFPYAELLIAFFMIVFFVWIFVSARRRDRKFFDDQVSIVEGYLNSGQFSPSDPKKAAKEIRDLVWNRYLESIPKFLRWIMVKP